MENDEILEPESCAGVLLFLGQESIFLGGGRNISNLEEFRGGHVLHHMPLCPYLRCKLRMCSKLKQKFILFLSMSGIWTELPALNPLRAQHGCALFDVRVESFTRTARVCSSWAKLYILIYARYMDRATSVESSTRTARVCSGRAEWWEGCTGGWRGLWRHQAQWCQVT